VTHPAVLELTRRLLQRGDAMADVDIGEVPAAEYLSEERLAAERRAIFARVPQIVAVQAEVTEPGACLPVELAGTALLLVRDGDGALRCFKNACRHRATRLIGEGCRVKAIVCPYHGWTYDLAGGLVHVPHQDAFADRCRERDRLIEVPVAARHGMVWASLEPLPPDFLAPVDDELSESAGWTLYRRS
jgi:phenylpropionate dioxygenase-like ring-hydroxylating dioxygenase large terminal subunit